MGSSTVYDKIKTDFNTSSSKKDRCIHIKINEDGNSKDVSLMEFINRIKDLIISSFQQQVGGFEEDIKKIDSQRLMPGYVISPFIKINL
jgi:hypothetical protein